MGFEIGQIFDGEYPPECAVWCNRHGDRWIKEIEPLEGVRRFQIVKSPEPTPEEIAAQELEQAKIERAAAVAAIKVEVDEQAKQALAKAMLAMGELWTKPYELRS